MTSIRTLVFFVAAVSALAGCQKTEPPKPEEKGRAQAQEIGLMGKGVGEGIQETGAEAGKALAQGLSAVMKGAGEGFDKGLGDVQVEMPADAATLGLHIERANKLSIGAEPKVTVYLVSDKAFKGKLMMRALVTDASGEHEVGRASAEVEQQADDAKYVDFKFDERTPLLQVTKVQLKVTPQ